MLRVRGPRSSADAASGPVNATIHRSARASNACVSVVNEVRLARFLESLGTEFPKGFEHRERPSASFGRVASDEARIAQRAQVSRRRVASPSGIPATAGRPRASSRRERRTGVERAPAQEHREGHSSRPRRTKLWWRAGRSFGPSQDASFGGRRGARIAASGRSLTLRRSKLEASGRPSRRICTTRHVASVEVR